MAHIVESATVGLLPVLTLLATLLYLDSYKLVRLRAVIAVLGSGAAIAAFCYVVNAYLVVLLGMDLAAFARYVAPLSEELLKSLVVVALIRSNRIGFLIDAAIFGFAVGTGFATVENLYYLEHVRDAGIGIWLVRGFGTALMHGGCTAIFAMMSVAMLERARHGTLAALVPGFIVAVLLHSAYNHMYVSPKLATAIVIVVLPPLLLLVFQRSEKSVSDWLVEGFDADTQMLEAITSGRFTESPAGRYLDSIKHRFKGPVVADLLCYVRLHTELALRAKGLLMMRENGFEMAIDDETRAKVAEMRYLKQTIGKTGVLAVQPMLYGSHKDIWQLSLLDDESDAAEGKPSPTD
ncbi:MAG TPA: PrsW family glutamic-type intramembrane protease [Casimicrobiaceae bacterium]|jgi:RsiW-degrading membrane proteinase PrsW (M82 family)